MYFATSSIPDYQTYFLKHSSSQAIKRYEDQIVELLFVENDYVPHNAMDALGDKFWSNPGKYNPVLSRITALKSHVINRILNVISAPNNQTKAILTTFRESDRASDKQKELILKICENEKQ